MNPLDLFPKANQSADETGAATTPLVLTVEAAAERLGIGRTLMYALVKSGAVESICIGRTLMYALVKSGAVESICIGRLRRIPVDALDTFIRSLRAANSDEAA